MAEEKKTIFEKEIGSYPPESLNPKEPKEFIKKKGGKDGRELRKS